MVLKCSRQLTHSLTHSLTLWQYYISYSYHQSMMETIVQNSKHIHLKWKFKNSGNEHLCAPKQTNKIKFCIKTFFFLPPRECSTASVVTLICKVMAFLSSLILPEKNNILHVYLMLARCYKPVNERRET